MHGSHWESNPRPPTLYSCRRSDPLSYDYPAATQHSPSVFELEEQANVGRKWWRVFVCITSLITISASIPRARLDLVWKLFGM